MDAKAPTSDVGQQTEQWIELATGSRLLRTWSQADPQRNVLIIHGLGEHSGRYHRLATALVADRCQVFSFDQQGHGLSPEPRGCVQSYDSMLDDIAAALHWIRSQSPHPTVLFGHSMGGNLVLNYSMRKSFQPQAVISSSPMIEAVGAPKGSVEMLLRVMKWILPNYRLKSVVDPATLMSDPEEQELLSNDDLFHSQLSLRLGAALLDSGRWLLNNAPKLGTPTLLMHGRRDIRTCPAASQRFAESAGEICRLEIFEDHLHDPFRDLGREEIIGLLQDFIRRSCSASGAED